jgi:hypothetical protein
MLSTLASMMLISTSLPPLKSPQASSRTLRPRSSRLLEVSRNEEAQALCYIHEAEVNRAAEPPSAYRSACRISNHIAAAPARLAQMRTPKSTRCKSSEFKILENGTAVDADETANELSPELSTSSRCQCLTCFSTLFLLLPSILRAARRRCLLSGDESSGGGCSHSAGASSLCRSLRVTDDAD